MYEILWYFISFCTEGMRFIRIAVFSVNRNVVCGGFPSFSFVRMSYLMSFLENGVFDLGIHSIVLLAFEHIKEIAHSSFQCCVNKL